MPLHSARNRFGFVSRISRHSFGVAEPPL